MADPPPSPDDILSTYDAVGRDWARARDTSLYEEPWLRRFLDAAPGPRVLDLGCGSGVPLARWMAAKGARVTGVDGAATMCAQFREALPDHRCLQEDMRTLCIAGQFDGILAWNSFFHLSAADQRRMFAVFAAHSAPGAALMFTSGPAAGTAIGAVAGHPVFHASLDPAEYRSHLKEHGFCVLAYAPEDPECRGHTLWLARRTDMSQTVTGA